jgi:hypothetical protein
MKTILMQKIDSILKENASMRFYDVRKGKTVKYRLKIMLRTFATEKQLAEIAALKGVVSCKNYYAKHKYWRTYNERFVCIYLHCKLTEAY